MRVVLNLISLLSFSPFIVNITEEDIGKNISDLKKYQWFQEYLSIEKYQKLITYDNDVRKVIGEFNKKKIARDTYHRKCEKKLRKILKEKLKDQWGFS